MPIPSSRSTSEYTRFPQLTRRAQRYELVEGEQLRGRVVRLPEPALPYGRYLLLESTPDRFVALRATEKDGWAVLARNLTRVKVGDEVSVTFRSWRESAAGRRYRDVRVEVLP